MIKSTFTEAHSFQNSSLFLSSTHFTCPSYGMKHTHDRHTSHNTYVIICSKNSDPNQRYTLQGPIQITSTRHCTKRKENPQSLNQNFLHLYRICWSISLQKHYSKLMSFQISFSTKRYTHFHITDFYQTEWTPQKYTNSRTWAYKDIILIDNKIYRWTF